MWWDVFELLDLAIRPKHLQLIVRIGLRLEDHRTACKVSITISSRRRDIVEAVVHQREAWRRVPGLRRFEGGIH